MRNYDKNIKYKTQNPQKVGLILKKYLKGMKFLKYPVKIKDPEYIVPCNVKSEREEILKCSNFINDKYKRKFSKEYVDTLHTMLNGNFEHYTQIRSKINFDNIGTFIKYKNFYDKQTEENIIKERKNEEDEFKEEIKRLYSSDLKKYKRNFSEFDENNKNDNCMKSIENKNSYLNIFNNKKNTMNDDTNSFKTQCSTYNNNFLVTGQINKESMNTISTNHIIKGEKRYNLKDFNNLHIKNIKTYINNKNSTFINPKTNEFFKLQEIISIYKPLKTTDLMSYNTIENYQTKMYHNPKSMDKNGKNIFKRNTTFGQNFLTIDSIKSNKKRNIRSAFIKSLPSKFEKFSKYKLQFENSLNRDFMKISDKDRVKNMLLNGEYFEKKHKATLVQQKIKSFNRLSLKERKKLFDNDDNLL